MQIWMKWFSVLLKEGTRRQNMQWVPFLGGIIWCLSRGLWNHYCNLARPANKIEIRNKRRRLCLISHYLLSSVIIEKFMSKKNKKICSVVIYWIFLILIIGTLSDGTLKTELVEKENYAFPFWIELSQMPLYMPSLIRAGSRKILD